MIGSAAPLVGLRAKLEKDLGDLRHRAGKGLKRKEYWQCCGRIAQVETVIAHVTTLIKTENGGNDDDADPEKD